MSENTPEQDAKPTTKPKTAKKPFEPILENHSFLEMLRTHLGKIFLIANPESFEEGGLGPQIQAGYYKAKLIGMGKDYLIVMTEFQHGAGKKATKEPVKQYIPIDRVKRVSLMRSERLIHI